VSRPVARHKWSWARPWIETHRQALTSARLAGNDQVTVLTLNNLGMAHVDRGEPAAALDQYAEAMRPCRSLEDEPGAATTGSNQGWANLYLGNYTTALRQLEIALDFYQRTGAVRNAAITLRGIALSEAEIGSFANALHHAEQARDEVRHLDLELDMAMALNCIAWVHFRANRYREAAEYYKRAVESGERSGSQYEVARAQTGLGNVAASMRDQARAIELWALAEESTSSLDTGVVGETRTRRSLERNSLE
jgi:tetratricopeptide (TPR) repeat protein